MSFATARARVAVRYEPYHRLMEIEIGRGKKARRAYGFDDIAIVPSRRTRDPEDVDISWEIDAYHFDLPLMGAAMDGVVSPATSQASRLRGSSMRVARIVATIPNFFSAETRTLR